MRARFDAADRGHSDFGWLDSHHTFSFGEFYDPTKQGFRRLRVINDDVVSPGQGFGTHGHRDMEIVSYVLDGGLEHKDSLGTAGVLRPGDVQRMSAGTGVRHSEFNASRTEPVHFLQVWIIPDRPGLTPSYEQKHFAADQRRGRLVTVASRDAADGALAIHADVSIHAGLLGDGQQVTHALAEGRHAYVHLARGGLVVDGERLSTGDGLAISGERSVTLTGAGDAEFLLFDLA